VLAIAKTGSGKTLGFLLPVLTRCQKEKPKAKGAPLGLVMAPTRELGLQIAAEATKFGEAVNCRVVAVYGGASKSTQVRTEQKQQSGPTWLSHQVLSTMPSAQRYGLCVISRTASQSRLYGAVPDLSACSIGSHAAWDGAQCV
jgi:hypothetical protein